MEIALDFVEYDVANGLRGLCPVAFTLLSAAKLGQAGGRRAWILSGSPEAFGVLRADLHRATGGFLRSSIAAAVADITKYIDTALAVSELRSIEAPTSGAPLPKGMSPALS